MNEQRLIQSCLYHDIDNKVPAPVLQADARFCFYVDCGKKCTGRPLRAHEQMVLIWYSLCGIRSTISVSARLNTFEMRNSVVYVCRDKYCSLFVAHVHTRPVSVPPGQALRNLNRPVLPQVSPVAGVELRRRRKSGLHDAAPGHSLQKICRQRREALTLLLQVS